MIEIYNMVQQVKQKNGDVVYKCEECGLKYPKEKDALRCESWCSEHDDTCDPNITENAIKEE